MTQAMADELADKAFESSTGDKNQERDDLDTLSELGNENAGKVDAMIAPGAARVDAARAAMPGLATGGGVSKGSVKDKALISGKGGTAIGTQQLSHTSMAAGVGGKHETPESEQRIVNGQTVTEDVASATWSSGVEAEITMVKNASEEQVAAAVDMLARAGAFGAVRKRNAIRNGRFAASAEGKASGGAGVQGGMKAGASADKTKIPKTDQRLVMALNAVVDASVRAGLWGEASGVAKASAGPAEVTVWGKIEGLLGAEMKGSAQAYLGVTGAGVEAAFEAFAGARVQASAGVSVGLGPAELELAAQAEAMAGAKVEAKGKLAVGPGGISAKASLEAFAGAKASVKGTAGLKLRGRTIVQLWGKVEVSAGAGVKAEGTFEIKDGKLSFSSDLTVALGLGGGAGAAAEIDAGALAKVIVFEAKQRLAAGEGESSGKSAAFERTAIEDEHQADVIQARGRMAVLEQFQIYANKKATDSRAKHGIKKEKVQEIIDNAKIFHAADLKYMEFDHGIEEAAEEAFGPMLKRLQVNSGNIVAFEALEDKDGGTAFSDFKKDVKQTSAQLAAKEALKVDLDALSEKAAQPQPAKGKTDEITKPGVQKIVNRHLPALRAAYVLGGAVDQAIVEAAAALQRRWLTAFTVSTYQIGDFDVRARDAMEDHQVALKGRTQAGKAFAAALRGYWTEVMTTPGAVLDPALVQTYVTAAIKGSGTAFVEKGSSAQLAGIVELVLKGVVSGVSMKDGVLSMTVDGTAVEAARTKHAGDAASATNNAAAAAARTFKTQLTAARERVLVAKDAKGKGAGDRAGTMAEEAKKVLADVMASSGAPAPHGGPASGEPASSELDAALRAVVVAVLGDSVSSSPDDLVLRDGRLWKIVVDADKLGEVSKQRQKDGAMMLLGGQEQDNDRRKLITDSLGTPFETYRAELLEAGDKDPTGKQYSPSAGKLDALIAKHTKLFRSDLLGNPVADKALTELLVTKFPMLKAVVVKDLAVHSVEIKPDHSAERKANQVMAKERPKIRELFKTTLGKDVSAATKESVQKQVTAAAAMLVGVPRDRADFFLTQEVSEVLAGKWLLTVVEGKVTGFRPAPPPRIKKPDSSPAPAAP